MTISRRDGALLLLAALPRLAYLLIARPSFAGPYWQWSDQLLATGSLGFSGVTGTDFEPIYPVFLAAARILTRGPIVGVQLVQIGISSVGAILLYRLARALTGSSRVALFTALLYAGDLLLIKQSVGQSPLVLVTTLLIAFTWAFVTATTTTRIVGAGLMLGLLVLTRTMTLPLVGGVLVILAIERRAGAALAATVAAFALIIPWSVRNHIVNDSWWPTRNGLNLFISSVPAATTLVPDYDVDLLEPLTEAVIAEGLRGPDDGSPESVREIDRILTRRAFANFSADPLRTFQGRAWNLAHYFWPPLVPYYVQGPQTRIIVGSGGGVAVVGAVTRSRAEIVAYSGYYGLMLLAAIAGALDRRHILLRGDAMLMWILGTFALTHAVYFPATRYRAPVMFILLFYAAVAVDRGYHVWRARRHLTTNVSIPTPA